LSVETHCYLYKDCVTKTQNFRIRDDGWTLSITQSQQLIVSICIISSEDANSDQDADKVNKNYKFQKFKMVETFTDADF